ncbi:FkbM family methyltransferase [Ilumatobacter sp.]|uniref:FkbM family methyltransferase n=1 Tax=Ilumatobacter sp. TaxID=1967498 RepID=UPI003AF8021C
MELFFALCSAVDVDVFVEAGAKEASASVRAVESAVPTVIAFEANPYTHRRFVRALEAAGVDYRHTALSERTGEATFLVRKRDDGSPMADGQGSLLVRPDHDPGYEEVTVAAAMLDDEIASEGRVAMWVDVEGAVAEVLGGAHRTLGRTDLVIVEVEEVERWVGQRWLASDVVEQLARRGLRAVARDMQSRWQFNILFVRDELLADGSIEDRIAAWRRGSRADR